MERIRLIMVRSDLKNLPNYPLPNGFRIRTFRQGEESIWAEIQYKAGAFASFDDAKAKFDADFAPNIEKFEERCLFAENFDGIVVGTATAWVDTKDFPDENYGRLHWVGVLPEFQGKGIGKALISEALKLMSQHHKRACLGTHPPNLAAIHIYLEMGFKPYPTSPESEKAWKNVLLKLRKYSKSHEP